MKINLDSLLDKQLAEAIAKIADANETAEEIELVYEPEDQARTERVFAKLPDEIRKRIKLSKSSRGP